MTMRFGSPQLDVDHGIYIAIRHAYDFTYHTGNRKVFSVFYCVGGGCSRPHRSTENATLYFRHGS